MRNEPIITLFIFIIFIMIPVQIGLITTTTGIIITILGIPSIVGIIFVITDIKQKIKKE